MSIPRRAVRELFNPRAIALVGATDKSGWSVSTYENLRAGGFPGTVYLVNPRTEVVHGERAYPSLSALPGPVDLAFVMVPTTAVLPVLREGAGLGIRSYVVLTAGFGETGEEGRRREDDLAAFARRHGLTVLGPNGNGYLNVAANVMPYGLPLPAPLPAGPVGIVLQSGALASSLLAFAQARAIGISLLTSMGNETLVSVTDVVDYLVDDPATRVIALFLESVRRPADFARAVRRAAAAGKPVVAMKIGSSPLASSTARAHTGALVGDDDVVDAAFRQLGVVRVRALEDLMITAGLLGEIGPLPGSRLGVVTPSGGASEIIADRAEAEGLSLPPFAPTTAARLKAILPDFATVQNPLDVTGYVVVDRTLLGRALDVVVQDPGIDAVLLLSELPRVPPAGDPAPMTALFGSTAERIRTSPRPVVVVGTMLTDVTDYGRTVAQRTGFPLVVGGIEHGMSALGAAARWSPPRACGPRVRGRGPAPVVSGAATGVWTEHQAARLLADNGVPVVPSAFASDEDGAAAAAESLGYPVVVKAVAPGLLHKSDAGAVRLHLINAGEVRRAHREVLAAARARDAAATGTLIQPHRTGGVELLVGVVRDPAWGLALAVGLGGIWVEALRDSALRLLPVDAAEIRRALGELRGADVLRGTRGTEPADLDVVAGAIAAVARLAEGLGDRLEALEINPLLVRGTRVEALDALVTWRP
ncbi:acetate--CoA ligase family protein [Actinoplanes sp. NPDC049681]|uniref:acetate--CoA ligase family protein n=1 Tax=Actinoplanes sp. NPDC049681 TaxID=3363905 RepID=UPI00378DE34D